MLNWPRNGGCIRTQPTKLKRRTVSYAFFTREVAHRCSCNIEITRSFDRTARPRNLCYSRARNESFSTRRKRGGSEKEEEKFNFRSPRNLFKRGIYRLEYLAPRFSLLLFNSSPVAMTLLPILPRPYFFTPSRSRRRARETEGSSCTRRRARTVTKGSAYSWGNLYVNVRRM